MEESKEKAIRTVARRIGHNTTRDLSAPHLAARASQQQLYFDASPVAGKGGAGTRDQLDFAEVMKSRSEINTKVKPQPTNT